MIQDNQWHVGICVKMKDGNFALFDNFAQAEETREADLPVEVQFQDVKYNWNRGQPIVDFGDFKMTIIDGEWK
jgi:hypothetical protein